MRRQNYTLKSDKECSSILDCKNTPKDAESFLACSRCRSVCYCCQTCQKKSWKFHKAIECKTLPQRIASVVDLYKTQEYIDFDVFKLEIAAKIALVVTRHQPIAAWQLIVFIETCADVTFGFNISEWPGICADLFSTRVSVNDVFRLEQLLGVYEFNESERRVRTRGEAQHSEKMMAVHQQVDELFGAVVLILPFVKLERGENQDFKSDLELVEHVHGQTRDAKNIPWFLSLIDDCCKGFKIERNEDGQNQDEARGRLREIEVKCERAWISYYRKEYGDAEKSDEECLKFMRTDEFIRRLY